jgi:hypothetical protein
MNIKLTPTQRGFLHGDFKDRYGTSCSIQKSSLATEDAIWFGVNDANPQILARDARALGIATEQVNGWVPFQIPDEVLLTTRMHLTREMVADLLPILQRFVDTGELEEA